MNPDSDNFAENYIKDHLGNVRVAYYLNNGVVTTRQIGSYYPFGMNIKGLTVNKLSAVRPNEYLYNGKMFQDEGGLSWLDYGARFYDAQIGRWHVSDPLEEKYPSVSTYTYCMNNPMILLDPAGQEIQVTFKGEGAEDLYKKIINSILNKQFEVKLTAVDGKKGTFTVKLISTKGGGDISKLSKGAQSFYNNFNAVCTDPTVVPIDVFNGSSDVVVGNYKNNAIDVADMNQFNEYDPNKSEQPNATKQGKMIHETRELFGKALSKIKKGSDEKILTNHEIAIGFENRVNGNVRLNDITNGRNGGIIERYRLSNGTVVKLQVVGGQNSTVRPIIIVKPLK